ncbi:hypothetical protein BV20DRAFT_296471 [Pilatotrama ljubarskyi]|nr:hypothetical protein BV20DRAFT_296471 [Pilatotrama ljubarskyi]
MRHRSSNEPPPELQAGGRLGRRHRSVACGVIPEAHTYDFFDFGNCRRVTPSLHQVLPSSSHSPCVGYFCTLCDHRPRSEPQPLEASGGEQRIVDEAGGGRIRRRRGLPATLRRDGPTRRIINKSAICSTLKNQTCSHRREEEENASPPVGNGRTGVAGLVEGVGGTHGRQGGGGDMKTKRQRL